MDSNKYPSARMKNILVQESEKEILIYDSKTDKAYCLNETVALVWQLCDGKRDVSEIERECSKKFQSSLGKEATALALDLLKKENLLIDSNRIDFRFSNFTRREAIRKIGLGSLIAFPLITTLMVPTSAQAASNACSQFGAACTQDSDCCPNQGLSCNLDCGYCISGLGGCL